MDQEELEKNARFRAEALKPVVDQLVIVTEQLLLVIDLLTQIREVIKRNHQI